MSHGATRAHALLTGALLAWPATVQAQPVNATNLTPFTAVLGQPAMRTAALPGRGHLEWQADVAMASHSAIGVEGGEFAFIDGQTLRLAAGLRYQPADRWQLTLEIPWISHTSGFLDPTIEEWHNLTGLTNGERDLQGRDRLRVAYAGASSSFELADSGDGIGDIRVGAVYALRRGGQRQAAVRTTMELPTGNAARLTGNGATDVAIDLLVSGRATWHDRRLEWHTQAGVLFPGDGDLLPALQRDAVAFGGFALDWQWLPRINLFVQTAVSGAPWDSDVNELGAYAVELTAGLSWPARRGHWHAAFSEDLRIDRSPDFVLRLGWRSQERSP